MRRSFICRSIYTSFFLKNPSLRRSREKTMSKQSPLTSNKSKKSMSSGPQVAPLCARRQGKEKGKRQLGACVLAFSQRQMESWHRASFEGSMRRSYYWSKPFQKLGHSQKEWGKQKHQAAKMPKVAHPGQPLAMLERISTLLHQRNGR